MRCGRERPGSCSRTHRPDELIARGPRRRRRRGDARACRSPAGLIDEFAQARPVSRKRLSALTEREREVLAAMAKGLSNAEVGASLFMSEGTVRTHVNRLLAKLQVPGPGHRRWCSRTSAGL